METTTISFKSQWKWLAMDEDGIWFLYSEMPVIDVNRRRWCIGPHPIATSAVKLQEDTLELPCCEWQESLHSIEEGQLVKHIKLKRDDKVLVRDACGKDVPRHFSHYNKNGEAEFFNNGTSSFTSKQMGQYTTVWARWRLPTEGELE
jgi:hypothetical protein